MKFSAVPVLLTLLVRAGLTAGETFSIPLDLRGLENLEFEERDLNAVPPGVKVPGTNPLYLCGNDDSGDIVHIQNVDFSPATPVRGAELVVSAAGTVSQTISKGAMVRVQIRLAGSKVYDKKYDLCEGLKRFGHSCPFAPGTVDITKGFVIPRKIPHGRYSARIKVDTADKKQITCFVGTFKI